MITGVLKDWTYRVTGGERLDDGAIAEIVSGLASPGVDAADKADFLIAFSRRGETPGEIAAFARELRNRSVPVPTPAALQSRPLLDVCGTGGDRLNTFNISTTVAIVCSAAGVAVAKHGNRAITSASGSADVLEALGIPIRMPPTEAAEALSARGFAFFFAPDYHPVFQFIGPARKICAERGQRTLFNFLGPLLNPARPNVQLLGVSRAELTRPVASTLGSLGVREALVVSGDVPGAGPDGGTATLDELSTLGANHVAHWTRRGDLLVDHWHTPPGVRLQSATLRDLAGGDKHRNAEIVRAILGGTDTGPRLDAVLLNAAAALWICEKAASLSAGWLLAQETIQSGRAASKLSELASPA